MRCAEWFCKQLAYPLKRIPPGMRLKALEHRRKMEEFQKSQGGSQPAFSMRASSAAAAPRDCLMLWTALKASGPQ